MASAPIRFYNRYTQTVETEKVAGEGWMRWLYETGSGQLALHLLVRRAALSRLYGWRMNQRYSAHKVLPFILEHEIDDREFAKSPFLFKTFNEFFTRALKPEARPVAEGDDVAVFPADGRHLAFPDVDQAEGFYVKGEKFSLAELLGDAALAEQYAGAAMLISRLCPVDYHRFHFPTAGVPGETQLINGWLYSVSPIALRRNIRYLIANKRMLTRLVSPQFGDVLMIEVGATMVGTIKQLFVSDRAVAKGEEKGLFKIGGSCVITLFPPGRIRFDDDLTACSADGVELFARMGDRLGVANG
ncbi:MAG: phosphatidylserine decarboxylase [Opitutae bacterium]|nr:phosphatidylserine decarboxylase [Opitutae bacterium]